MEFEWNDIKSDKIKRERGFGLDYVSLIFQGTTFEEIDDRSSDYGEIRIRAIGMIENRCYTVIYTDKIDEDGILVRRLITTWKSNSKEQRLWRLYVKI
jgi:uncharacterized protein